MSFVKFPSIDKFSDVYKWSQRLGVEKVTYGAKIKLHGTNAAIRIEGNTLTGQKRTSDVTVDADNCGFAEWVSTLTHPGSSVTKIIFGEWAGPGVQKTDAVCMIPEKHFFVFSIYYPDRDEWVVEPNSIIPHLALFEDGSTRMKVLPWAFEMREVDFRYQDNCQAFIDFLTDEVDKIGECDPYIKKQFGIEGPGEGLVLYPMEQGGKFMFKVKTVAHSVQKNKKRNHVAPEKPEGVEEFLDMFLTVPRFEQMLNEHLDGEADRKKLGLFLKAVMSDVHKESVNELEASGLEWKEVTRYAPARIKEWFFKEADKL